MAIYRDSALTEQPIYGSSRIGMYTHGRLPAHRNLGKKRYELSNHLGNVLTVVTDNIGMLQDSVWATVSSTTDYYPFGLEMASRTYRDSLYRYGFNGKEKDQQGEFGLNHYDYGFRIYNPSLGRFLSVDPLARTYPMLTPYQFASNGPIEAIDLDGLERYHYWVKLNEETGDPELRFQGVAIREMGWLDPLLFRRLEDHSGKLIEGKEFRISTGYEIHNFKSEEELVVWFNQYTSDNHEARMAETAVLLGISSIQLGILYYDLTDGDGQFDPNHSNRVIFPKPKSNAVVSMRSPKSYLDKALSRQGLNKPGRGLRESWVEGGYKYEVRIHPADPKFGKKGDIYRVGRRKEGVDSKGQGYGWEYIDSKGNWHHTSTLKPGKGGEVNPKYNAKAAEDTHIIVPEN